MRLQGKIAIKTGATSSMGKGMAERIVNEEASVILSGRDEPSGKDLEKNLIPKGSSFILPVRIL
jgi:NADP-dependent 3-hydroxy acid dehydrogenase YdfG